MVIEAWRLPAFLSRFWGLYRGEWKLPYTIIGYILGYIGMETIIMGYIGIIGICWGYLGIMETTA